MVRLPDYGASQAHTDNRRIQERRGHGPEVTTGSGAPPGPRDAAAPGRDAGGERNNSDQQAGGSILSLPPETAAVERISRSLALVVWTHNGTRSLTRTYQTTRAAERAVDRARERGDRVAVVLVRLVPMGTAVDPAQLEMLVDSGAA